MAFRPDADSQLRFDSPLVQDASRDVVHRLRLNTMQRPGHTGAHNKKMYLDLQNSVSYSKGTKQGALV